MRPSSFLVSIQAWYAALQVVQAIGAAENNVLDFGAPKRIDGTAAIDLVNASVEAGITQYVMVTSLGTGKFGWPASKSPFLCLSADTVPPQLHDLQFSSSVSGQAQEI